MDEVYEEAHLSPDWILKGIERFVIDRDCRLRKTAEMLESAQGR